MNKNGIDPDELTDELAEAAGIDPDALAGLITLERRRINTSGTSARLTVPAVDGVDLVGKVGLTAVVCLRRVDDSLVLTAKFRPN